MTFTCEPHLLECLLVVVADPGTELFTDYVLGGLLIFNFTLYYQVLGLLLRVFYIVRLATCTF